MAITEVISFNEKKYLDNKIYPVGTVIWRMQGVRQNSEITWYPLPLSIESYSEEMRRYKVTGGLSVNKESLGKTYFLSRNEALDHFFSSHDSLTSIIPITDPLADFLPEEECANVKIRPQTDYNDLEICQFDTVTASAVYLGLFTELDYVSDSLDWRKDEEAAEMYGIDEANFLTLKEIYEQIRDKFGDSNGTPIITVIIDEPLRGTIYQCNNHSEGVWEKVGDTRGYA